MLSLAFEGVDKVEVCDFEIQKQGKSYTYQTVEHFYRDDQQLYFIMGGDMLVNFKTWKYPERILDKRRSDPDSGRPCPSTRSHAWPDTR